MHAYVWGVCRSVCDVGVRGPRVPERNGEEKNDMWKKKQTQEFEKEKYGENWKRKS